MEHSARSLLDVLRGKPSSLGRDRIHAPARRISTIGRLPPALARGIAKAFLAGNELHSADGLEQLSDLEALSLAHNPVSRCRTASSALRRFNAARRPSCPPPCSPIDPQEALLFFSVLSTLAAKPSGRACASQLRPAPSAVLALRGCPRLRRLWLAGSPFARLAHARALAVTVLPQLRELDGVPVSQSDRSAAPSVVASVGAEYEAAAAREAENEALAGLARRLALLSQLEDTFARPPHPARRHWAHCEVLGQSTSRAPAAGRTRATASTEAATAAAAAARGGAPARSALDAAPPRLQLLVRCCAAGLEAATSGTSQAAIWSARAL